MSPSNASDSPNPGDDIVRDFINWAETQSGSILLSQGGLDTTYGEVEDASSRLAQELLTLGLVGALIGLCLRRSPELIVAMLAIWRVGGAVVVLDPDWPTRRLTTAIEELALSHVIMDGARIGGTRAAAISPQISASKPRLQENLPRHAATAAVVVSVCETTTAAQWVVLPQNALSKRINNAVAAHDLGPADHMLWASPPSTAFGLLEFLPALAVGAHLSVPAFSILAAPSALKTWMAEKAVTFGCLFSPLGQVMVRTPWPARGLLRKLVVPHVDAAPSPTSPSFEVSVEYGQAEIGVAFSRLASLDETTVGEPRGRAGVYILDPQMRPVDAGQLGELCVASNELADGYLDDPRETADRFIPCPSGRGARMFRTRARARLEPDGSITLHGRLDRRISISGVPIDLSAVEAVLTAHPAVRQALVTMESVNGLTRTAASISPKREMPTYEEMRSYLLEWMSPHALPHVLRDIRVPERADGAADILEATEFAGGTWSEESSPPLSLAEAAVLDSWREVMPSADIRVGTNFLDIGGNSMQAQAILGILEDRLGLRMTIGEFFQEPTPHSIARRLNL